MTKRSISELVPAKVLSNIQDHLGYVWNALSGDESFDPAIAQQATIQVFEQVKRLIAVQEAHTALISNLKSMADEMKHQRDIMLWERDYWQDNGKAEAVADMARMLAKETGEKEAYIKMAVEILIGERGDYVSVGGRRAVVEALTALLDEIFEESA